MRVLIVCGCLEQSRDGVGDYSRKLGEGLARKGYQVLLVSLRDKYVTSSIFFSQECINKNLKIFRISQSLSVDQVWRHFFFIINKYKPTLISLQYVPYSFSAIGLPLFILPLVYYASRLSKVHITFHELWITPIPSRRYRYIRDLLLYQLQKLIVKLLALFTASSVSLPFTSTPEYHQTLKKIGVNSCVHPIFSSVSFTGPIQRTRTLNLADSWIDISSENILVIAFFGSIRTQWKDNGLRSRIMPLLRVLGKDTVLYLSIGNLTSDQKERWEFFAKDPFCGVEFFVHLGILSESEVSSYLYFSDFGVAMNSYSLLFKSSSLAAMRSHGIPVIITSNVYEDPVPESEQWWAISLDSNFEKRMLASQKYEPINTLDNVVSSIVGIMEKE